MEQEGRPPPLFSVYSVVTEMLRDRGYIVPRDNKPLPDFLSDFCTWNPKERVLLVDRNKMAMSLLHAKDYNRGIRVFFIASNKVGEKMGKGQLESILSMLDEKRGRVMLIVSDGNELTAHARKVIDGMNRGLDKSVHVECFMESELCANVTQVARREYNYELLSDVEKQGVYARFGRFLQRITATDAVARHFGMQHGEMLKCTRASESAGRYSTYKVCVYPEEQIK